MGHSGYASKSIKRKKTKSVQEKGRRARTSKMRLRRIAMGLRRDRSEGGKDA